MRSMPQCAQASAFQLPPANAFQLSPLPRFVRSLKAYRMPHNVKHTHGPGETEAAGAELARRLGPGDVVLVSGDLGSGKTTFVRGACRALGVEAPVTSPTFVIGQVYAGAVEVAHLDLYRLDSLGGAGAARAPGRRPAPDHGGVNVLGFDTSTDASSACVLRDDGQAFEVRGEPGSRAHARELMPAV